MTNKVRMRVTVTFEYDADPFYYKVRKPIDMADYDRMQFEDGLDTLMEAMSSLPIKIDVEPINGND